MGLHCILWLQILELLTFSYVWITNTRVLQTAKPRLAQLKLVSCSLQEKEDFRTDLITTMYMTGNLVPKSLFRWQFWKLQLNDNCKSQASL